MPSRVPCLRQQAYREARKEQAKALQEREHEFRMVLARCGAKSEAESSFPAVCPVVG